MSVTDRPDAIGRSFGDRITGPASSAGPKTTASDIPQRPRGGDLGHAPRWHRVDPPPGPEERAGPGHRRGPPPAEASPSLSSVPPSTACPPFGGGPSADLVPGATTSSRPPTPARPGRRRPNCMPGFPREMRTGAGRRSTSRRPRTRSRRRRRNPPRRAIPLVRADHARRTAPSREAMPEERKTRGNGGFDPLPGGRRWPERRSGS